MLQNLAKSCKIFQEIAYWHIACEQAFTTWHGLMLQHKCQKCGRQTSERLRKSQKPRCNNFTMAEIVQYATKTSLDFRVTFRKSNKSDITNLLWQRKLRQYGRETLGKVQSHRLDSLPLSGPLPWSHFAGYNYHHHNTAQTDFCTDLTFQN